MKTGELVNMKWKKIAAGMFVSVGLISATAAAQGMYVMSSYDPDLGGRVEISGTAKVGEDITMQVVPYDKNVETMKVEEANQSAVYYITAADKDGNFTCEIGLPAYWENGLYKVLLYQEDTVAESRFSYSVMDAASLKALNLAKNPEEIAAMLMQLGAEAEHSEKYGKRISDYLYQSRPAAGYTEKSFLNRYTAALALYMMKDGDMESDDVFTKFAAYFDIDGAEDYENESAAVKKEVGRLMKKLAVGDKEAGAFYRHCLLLAGINAAETLDMRQSVILEHKDVLGLDLSDYNAISGDYRKAMVFEKMGKGPFEDDKEIARRFHEAAREIRNSQAESGSGGSGAYGGSGGSRGSGGSGSYGGGFAIDEKTENTPNTDLPPDKTEFSDITGHWAYEAVSALRASRIVNGFPNGRFMPDQSVSRAEFAKMICLAMQIDTAGGAADFFDVSDGAWYASYIKALADKGIVTGFSDGGFHPDEVISRQDAAVMLWRCLYGGQTESDRKDAVFHDFSEVDGYAKTAVLGLYEKGLVSGYENRFYPKTEITRAEAAQLLYRCMN